MLHVLFQPPIHALIWYEMHYCINNNSISYDIYLN